MDDKAPSPERTWTAFHADDAQCAKATTTHDCPHSHRYERATIMMTRAFASRPPFNDDPLPWVGKAGSDGMPNRYGSREVAEGAPFWDTATHDARPAYDRPQHNPTNHALAHFRGLHGRKAGHELVNAAVHWLASLRDMRIADAYTAAEEQHARCVLNLLVRLGKESA